MKLLALETANEQCSVSVIDETEQLFYRLDDRARAQTQTILPMIEQAMQQTSLHFSDLTAIAFSRGPGSFSGVRINAAVTQALAWANDLPVIPVSTLQALAQAAYQMVGLQQVTAVLDARMQEVYIANYTLDASGIMQCVDEEQLVDYQRAKTLAQFRLVGSGSHLVDTETIGHQHIVATANEVAIIAREQAKLQRWVGAEHALPVYLRDNAWKKIAEQGGK